MSANELVPPIATSDPARPVSAAEIEVVLNRASEASITARDRRLTTDQTSVSRDFRPYALSLDDAWRQAIYTTSDDHTSSRLLEEGPFLASVDDNMNETPPGATEDWAAFLRRRHARRLRREARDAYEAVLRNQTSLYPAADGVPADRPATRGFVTDRGRRTAVPDAPGSGGYRLLVDLQARMRSDMRVERPRSISPGTRVGDASRNARRALPLGKPHQGMQPTNLAENLANQPIIVKSTPPSPASTAPRSRICDIYPTRGIPRDIEDMDPGRATPFRSSGDDRTFDIPEDETEPADGGHGHSFVIPPRSDSEDDSDDSASSSTSEGSGGTAIYWHPPSTLGRSLRDLPDSALTARGRRVANRQAAAAEADRAQPDDVERSNTRRTVSLGLQNESPDVARTILDIVTRIHANRPQAVPPPAAADFNEDFDERFDVVPGAETHPVTAAEILDRVDSSERLRSLAQEIIRHTPRTPSSLSRQYPTAVVSAINAGFDFWTPPPPPLTSEPEPTADIFISAAGRAHTAQNLDLDVARERIRSLAQLRRDMSTVRSGGWIRVPDAGSVPGPGSMPVAPPVDNSVPTPEVQGGSDAAGSEPHLHSTRDRAVMFRRMLERAEIEIDEMIATNASSGTVGDTALAPTSTATVATTAADVDGNGDETAEPKTTGEF